MMKNKNKEKSENQIFEPSTTELMKILSDTKSLNKLDDIINDVFDRLNVYRNSKKYLNNNKKHKEDVNSYEEKVSAIKRLWRMKIVMDVNLNLNITDRDYHKSFDLFDFDLDSIKNQLNSLQEDYQKYFYNIWIKCNYRISKEMNWEGIYSKHDETTQFCLFIERNIKKYFTEITNYEPTFFSEQTNKGYSYPVELTITKQFLSKLINAAQATNINFDKNKFCESFGLEYDNTIRTAYNKVNKEGSDTTKTFFNSFWNYLTDDEKENIAKNFYKEV